MSGQREALANLFRLYSYEVSAGGNGAKGPWTINSTRGYFLQT